eukprot:s4230_g3.t1
MVLDGLGWSLHLHCCPKHFRVSLQVKREDKTLLKQLCLKTSCGNHLADEDVRFLVDSCPKKQQLLALGFVQSATAGTSGRPQRSPFLALRCSEAKWSGWAGSDLVGLERTQKFTNVFEPLSL